jgi:hypothetical protein
MQIEMIHCNEQNLRFCMFYSAGLGLLVSITITDNFPSWREDHRTTSNKTTCLRLFVTNRFTEFLRLYRVISEQAVYLTHTT